MNGKMIINRIVEKIKKEYKPEKIILFGSYAYGKPTKDSDIDLLTVVDNKKLGGKRVALKQTVLNNLPIQIVMMTFTEFLETKDVIGGLSYPASKYGKVLYAK